MASYYRALEEQWAEGTGRIQDAARKADLMVAAARARQAENSSRLDMLRVRTNSPVCTLQYKDIESTTQAWLLPWLPELRTTNHLGCLVICAAESSAMLKFLKADTVQADTAIHLPIDTDPPAARADGEAARGEQEPAAMGRGAREAEGDTARAAGRNGTVASVLRCGPCGSSGCGGTPPARSYVNSRESTYSSFHIPIHSHRQRP